MDITNEYLSEENYNRFSLKYNELIKGINNQIMMILENNNKLVNEGAPISSYLPLVSDMSKFEIKQSFRFKQLIDMFEELKNIATKQKEIIESQNKDIELLSKGVRPNKIDSLSEIKTSKGEGALSTEGIFDDPVEPKEIDKSSGGLNSGLNSIF